MSGPDGPEERTADIWERFERDWADEMQSERDADNERTLAKETQEQLV